MSRPITVLSGTLLPLVALSGCWSTDPDSIPYYSVSGAGGIAAEAAAGMGGGTVNRTLGGGPSGSPLGGRAGRNNAAGGSGGSSAGALSKGAGGIRSGGTSPSASGATGGNDTTPQVCTGGAGSCALAGAGGATGGFAGSTGGAIADQRSSGLAARYAQYFPIGAALNTNTLLADRLLIQTHFNRVTAENAMKGARIHPAEGTWNTTEADMLANFAREQGWKMTGHTLVWHQQQPDWMFAGLTASDPTSITTLKARLKSHIEGMVLRYSDVVDNWDVVNEAIGDGSAMYRTTGNSWYTVFGSEDYIYWAFRYTKDALEAQAAGSSAGKLYYNDYNVTQKVDRILAMCAWLENHPEGGIHIDGVGLQGHWQLGWPSTSAIGATIQLIADAGYKTKISELDITAYSDYTGLGSSFVAAPEVPFSPELDVALAARYAAIFSLFRSRAPDITSVTFWGVRDASSWLQYSPVPGRPNYPLLWNAAGAKQAYTAVAEF